MATRYIAALGHQTACLVHLVREDAEATLCGLPRSALSTEGRIDNTTVCRECIDWVPKRWTGNFPRATAS